MGRSWRTLATALSFAAFGVGGLVLGALVFPAISLTARSDAERVLRARGCIGWSFRRFLWLMALLGVCRFDIDPNAKHSLAQSKGAIILANHPTLIDVIVLLAHADRAACVVKRALWHNRFVSHVVQAAGYIPNDDWETLAAACSRALSQGQSLIIFPEATRSVPGQPLRLRRGAAAIALETGAPMCLVHLDCAPPTLFKTDPWYRVPQRQPCLALRLGDTLDPTLYRRPGESLSTAARRLTQALQSRFAGRQLDQSAA